MRRAATLLLGVSSALLAAAAPVTARSGPEEEGQPSPRRLNGHVFLPSRFMASPFSSTHLGSTTTYAIANATASLYNLRGDVIGERSYSAAAFGNQFDLQLRLADFLAVRASVSALVFSGTDAKSAVAVGATVRSNFGFGVTAGLPLGKAVRVAALFDAGYQPAFDLTIAAGILRALSRLVFDSGEVFVVGQTWQLRPGISAAWAPIPLLGLQGEVRYVHTEVEHSSSVNPSGDAVDLVFLLEADLGTVTKAPIAFAALYRHQEPTSGQTIRIDDVGGGVFYTGRLHLAAGVVVTQQWFNLRPRLDTSATMGDLVVRYYW